MKQLLFAAVLLLTCAPMPLLAQTPAAPAPVTAESVTPAAIRAEMAKLDPAQRADYAKKMMSIISTLPIPPEEKAQIIGDAAVTLVAAAGATAKADVITAIFSGVPLDYIGVVADRLAPGFDQKKNALSNEAYDDFAERVISSAEARLKADRADMPIARLTVITSLFIRGSADPERATNEYINYLPKDESLRNTVKSWLPDLVRGDYSKIAAIGGLKELVRIPEDKARPPILERNILDTLAILSDTVTQTDQMFGLNVPVGLTDPLANIREPGNPDIGVPDALPTPPPPYNGQRTGG